MSRINVAPVMARSAPIHESGARQTFSSREELRRVLSCALLGERQFYVSAEDIEATIRRLAAVVPCEQVATLAVEARQDLGLRHAPILLLTALAARRECGPTVRSTAAVVLRTPRDAMDLVALYWKDGKKPLPAAFKRAIGDGFARWTDYQIAKYATLDSVVVRLRDLLFLAHVKPKEGREALFKALADKELRAPDTWEAALSVPGADKRAVWERLLADGRLGSLALVRNLRNMEQVGTDAALVRAALANAKAADVWPWQALAAAREAPAYTHDLDALMLRSAGTLPRLPGRTLVMVDVSGSMNNSLSDKGVMKRMDAAAGLAVVLREVCDGLDVVTFSSVAVHVTPLPRGATLAQAIIASQPHGGTNLHGALTATRAYFSGAQFDRVVILTDEQAQDSATEAVQVPTFVINLASYQRGIAWQGKVTRINGWSGGVVRWLAEAVTGQAVVASDAED